MQKKEELKLSPLEMARGYFSTHSCSEDQAKRMKALRDAGAFYVEEVLNNTKSGPDQTAAIRKLREAHMTLIQNISMEEFGR